jgi:hypothetical protein
MWSRPGTKAAAETIDKGHGRIESRRYRQSDDIDWFADRQQRKGLKSVGMVHSVREFSDGRMEEERRIRFPAWSITPTYLPKRPESIGEWSTKSIIVRMYHLVKTRVGSELKTPQQGDIWGFAEVFG